MRYTVLKPFRPKGSNNPMAQAGDELELGASQAVVFKALGWITAVQHFAPMPESKPIPEIEAPRRYVRKVVEEKPETIFGIPVKRVYKTRQLKAEE